MGLSKVKINSDPLQVCFNRNALQPMATNGQPFYIGPKKYQERYHLQIMINPIRPFSYC